MFSKVTTLCYSPRKKSLLFSKVPTLCFSPRKRSLMFSKVTTLSYSPRKKSLLFSKVPTLCYSPRKKSLLFSKVPTLCYSPRKKSLMFSKVPTLCYSPRKKSLLFSKVPTLCYSPEKFPVRSLHLASQKKDVNVQKGPYTLLLTQKKELGVGRKFLHSTHGIPEICVQLHPGAVVMETKACLQWWVWHILGPEDLFLYKNTISFLFAFFNGFVLKDLIVWC